MGGRLRHPMEILEARRFTKPVMWYSFQDWVRMSWSHLINSSSKTFRHNFWKIKNQNRQSLKNHWRAVWLRTRARTFPILRSTLAVFSSFRPCSLEMRLMNRSPLRNLYLPGYSLEQKWVELKLWGWILLEVIRSLEAHSKICISSMRISTKRYPMKNHRVRIRRK